MQELTANELDETLKGNDTVLVDFYADWCGPCKVMARELESYSADESAVPVVSLNIDNQANNDFVIEMGVQSIPTLVLFKGGKEAARHVGAVRAADVAGFVKENA